MLLKAKEKYRNLTTNQNGNTWGFAMRHTRLPSLTAWEKAKERVESLERELLKRKGMN